MIILQLELNMKKTLLALWVISVLSIGATAQDNQPDRLDAVLSAIDAINKNITEINKNITGMKTDIAVMKTDIAVINTRLNTIDGVLERQNNRMDVLDNKVDDLGNTMIQVQAIQTTTNTWLFWVLAIVLAILGYFFMVLRSLKPKEPNANKVFLQEKEPNANKVLIHSDEVFLQEKEPNAIQSSSEPELAGLRPKQRAKTRPAT